MIPATLLLPIAALVLAVLAGGALCAIAGAWIYHRGRVGLSPAPQVRPPAVLSIKRKPAATTTTPADATDGPKPLRMPSVVAAAARTRGGSSHAAVRHQG